MNKHLLFITHNASRTGAPIQLLHLAKLIINKFKYKIDFLIKEDGELSSDFQALGTTTILQKPGSTIITKVGYKIRNYLLMKVLATKIKKYQFVLSNTITNGDLHSTISRHNRIYTYVHELEYSTRTGTTEEGLDKVNAHTFKYFSPCKVIDNYLLSKMKIDLSRISSLPYYIPDCYVNKSDYCLSIRTSLGITEDTKLIGGMGLADWRKGSDIFLQIAKKYCTLNSSAKFVWCGGETGTKEWLAFNLDIQKLGLYNKVIVLPYTKMPIQIMSVYDIFLLTSREDPYPLVMVEAAMMKIPIVYFKQSGGADDFVAHECGIGVEYLNTEDAVNAISKLLNNNKLYMQLSEKAREKYTLLHSEEVVLNILDQFLNKPN